jgi:hypothetical protein
VGRNVLIRMRSAVALLIGLSCAAPVIAQDGTARPAAQAVDVDRLPVDLRRIQKRLNQYGDSVESDGLNLRYQIQIYGFAPPIEFFGEDANLKTGPVPYGAPTHREIIEHITPQEYRAPFVDFGALIRWLGERNKEKGKR